MIEFKHVQLLAQKLSSVLVLGTIVACASIDWVGDKTIPVEWSSDQAWISEVVLRENGVMATTLSVAGTLFFTRTDFSGGTGIYGARNGGEEFGAISNFYYDFHPAGDPHEVELDKVILWEFKSENPFPFETSRVLTMWGKVAPEAAAEKKSVWSEGNLFSLQVEIPAGYCRNLVEGEKSRK